MTRLGTSMHCHAERNREIQTKPTCCVTAFSTICASRKSYQIKTVSCVHRQISGILPKS